MCLGNRPEVVDDHFRSLLSSEVGVLPPLTVANEVCKRNCLSKHECTFHIVILKVYVDYLLIVRDVLAQFCCEVLVCGPLLAREHVG